MSAQVIAVNVQIPAATTAPVVADFTTHALRVGYFHRRGWQNLSADDWNVPGVYVLMTTDGSGIVYVGKSVKLRSRISTHSSDPQIEWRRALVVKRDTSHGFTSADIGYLEGRLAAELAAIPGIFVHRGKEDRDDTLPRHMELSLDELLGSILSAVRLAGLDVHKPADLPDDDEDAEDPAVSSADVAMPATTHSRRPRRTKKAKLPELVAAGLISAGTELHLSQGGTTATGTVSTQGEIVVDGVAYSSVSKAAQTALNSGRDEAAQVLSSNGWVTWHIGSLAGPVLDSLRDQYADAQQAQ
ncbi:excinuclease ABC subunit C [Gordonia alkaliphila]|uniref:restriction system modified-DNA reader domain-containing protein n=1 Tax=Gordonia alkaliphila TaxID=1053547 RepID=UPI001FF6B674|nr:excinuclease ABC subunit C [Gordonia alkaliphila]MCK0440315.1 excinuclease ABC subunit C [Gordonia alkaliphila]